MQISQRTQFALLIGMSLAGVFLVRPDQEEQRLRTVIANASTIPTLWSQSGPSWRVNWEGRDQWRTAKDKYLGLYGVDLVAELMA